MDSPRDWSENKQSAGSEPPGTKRKRMGRDGPGDEENRSKRAARTNTNCKVGTRDTNAAKRPDSSSFPARSSGPLDALRGYIPKTRHNGQSFEPQPPDDFGSQVGRYYPSTGSLDGFEKTVKIKDMQGPEGVTGSDANKAPSDLIEKRQKTVANLPDSLQVLIAAQNSSEIAPDTVVAIQQSVEGHDQPQWVCQIDNCTAKISGRRFRQDYARHYRECHLNERLYVCDYADVLVKDYGGCPWRMRDGKPNDSCGKGFKRKEHFKRHLEGTGWGPREKHIVSE
ncbi:hypothetical protein BJ508DRAFT_337851 [Ascobolus immersus RN42]|uniref:Uncharacterized protein n=1 Tax=Ascobolus immersus RN42 TaxID=1160509 RepID=A0A3N4HR98_ASCIM|nr:hypothetical protein BJ508DRAFT_337851 [Ascobolus immersus RN42]